MPKMDPQRELWLACLDGDMGWAVLALEAGAEPERFDRDGRDAFQLCLVGQRPEMAIDLQLLMERRGGGPWRGRAGQNGATRVAMSADGALMSQLIERMPHAALARDADGRSAADLFFEACAVRGAWDPHIERAARMAAGAWGEGGLEPALASCRIGLDIARGLRLREPGEGSALLSFLEGLELAEFLGPASEPSEPPKRL